MKRLKAAFFICVFLLLAAVFSAAAGGGFISAKALNGKSAGYANGASHDADSQSGEADTGFYSPDADEYYIGGTEELKGLALLVSEGVTFAGKVVRLVDDIDARGVTIGGAVRPFRGIFDGGENRIGVSSPLFFALDGAEIRNLFIKADIVDGRTEDRGILANVMRDSSAKNVAVDLRYINDSNVGNFGGIAALLENSRLENCAVKGLIKKEDGIVGGIAARAENSAIVSCYSNVVMDISYLSEYSVGGIVGRLVSSSVAACVNYAEITLKPFVEGIEPPPYGAAGLLVGAAEGVCGVSKSSYLAVPGFDAVGRAEGQTSAEDNFAYSADMLKSAAFLSMLNSSAGEELYRTDLAGYEENGGFPIFKFQIPKPVVALSRTGNGEIRVGGELVTKNFKTAFGESVVVTVKADAYYRIKNIRFCGDAISVGDGYEASFETGAVYGRSVLSVEFEREMRTVLLDGISASKVYDGTTKLDLSHLIFGNDGLFIKNPYFLDDDIRIVNGFTGDDPIEVAFGYPDAGTDGQCIVLRNVKFGGLSAEYYDLPSEFRIYAAEIKKAALSVSYGGIDADSKLYTPGVANSVYGDEAKDGKFFGMSVSDESLMLSGELFVEIFLGGGFRRLNDGERLPVGEYILRAAGISARNYDVTFEECVLTVEKRRLFAYFGHAETEYGTPPIFSFVFSNFAFGEGAEVLKSEPSLNSAPLLAGTHKITLNGGEAENYTVVNAEGEIVVNRKSIDAAIEPGQYKIYGDGEPLLFAYSDGLCYGDAISLVRAVGESAARYSYTGWVVAGNGYDATACYYINMTNADEKFEIKRRELTVAAMEISTVYGVQPSYKFSYINLAPNETGHDILALKLNVFLASDLEMRNPITSVLNAGAYFVMPYGAINDNYVISYIGGGLTVEKAPLTFIFRDASVVYGGSFSPQYTVSGFKYNQGTGVINSDGMTVRILNLEGGAERPDAGIYEFFADGFAAENYCFVFEKVILTVEKAPLTVAVKPLEETYGNIFNFEYEFSGFVGGDGIGALFNLRVDYILTTEIQTAVPYAESKNYELTFEGNLLKINKRALTVVGVTVADKLYDGTNAAAVVGDAVLSGAVFGDELTVSGTLKAVFDRVSAGRNIPVSLSGIAASGQNAHMYALTLPKLYGNISINTVSANGITVRVGGMLPSDSGLIVNFITDYSKIKSDIKKFAGSKRVYFAFDAEIVSEGADAVGKYYIYIPLTDELDVKNLKAVVYASDGRRTETQTVVRDGYIVVESEHLGRIALVKDDNFFGYIILAAFLAAAVAVFILYKKGKFKNFSGFKRAAANGNAAALPKRGYGNGRGYKSKSVYGREDDGTKNYENYDDISDEKYEEFITEAIDGATDAIDLDGRQGVITDSENNGKFAEKNEDNLFEDGKNPNDGFSENLTELDVSKMSDDEYQAVINEIEDAKSEDDIN
jgi:hypothetical protein